MKFAASLLAAAAVLAGGTCHAATGRLSAPPSKACVPQTVYNTPRYGYVPVWHRGPETGCRWTLVRLIPVASLRNVAATRR